jgi:glycosyltransferase involved in cell wall biosynthesis
MLTRELVRRGHRLTVVCRPTSLIGQQLAAEDVQVVLSDLHRWPPDQLRRVAAVCREQRIDVIHTHMSRAHLFGVLLRLISGVPSVATAHARHFQPHWMFNDRVIANSEATRRYHRRYNLVPEKRIRTIHCFVDYDRFARVQESARQEIRSEFNLQPDDLLIGQIGHVCPRKGQIHLVRAMQAVLARCPRAHLLLVGAKCNAKHTRYVDKVMQETKRLAVDHRVIWAGFRSDVPKILTALDVFVLASLEEAQGVAPLEAMVRELPVVATAVGGLPEVVRPDKTGLLVPPADPDALAAAILRLLDDPQLRCRFGRLGHQMVQREFSPMSQVPQIEAVLCAAAAQRKAAA